jgi:isoaspartyl peptidase/L-asparaginase-like protein (Ntn-hydrolase superfamily)
LTFNFSDSAADEQIALKIIDTDGSTVVMEVRPKYTTIIDRKLGASYGVFDNPACLNGTVAPVCIDLAGAGRIWGGVGAPGTTFTGTGRVGDVFLRTDGSAGTYYYLCTTAGTPGTWTAYA